MIEIPEMYVLSEQINQTLVGKTIRNVIANAHPHKFAWFTSNPNTYNEKLSSKKITLSNPGTGYTCGGNVEIICDDMLIVINTPIKYHLKGEKLPTKHQLLIEFEDDSHMSCTVQMWGAMFCFPINEDGLPNNYVCNKCPDPLTESFNEAYFNTLLENTKQSISVKAFLATEQRIPGFGNGVLQDVLWNANINPKCKLQILNDIEKKKLFHSIKSTLLAMKEQGGRDTERDLFGNKGAYKTVLSANTYKYSCPSCGNNIAREAYLGGNIYYCPVCQPMKGEH